MGELLKYMPPWCWIIITIVVCISICITFVRYWKRNTHTSYKANNKGAKSIGIIMGGNVGNTINNNYFTDNKNVDKLSKEEIAILKMAYEYIQTNYVGVNMKQSVFSKACRKLELKGYGSFNGIAFLINDNGRNFVEKELE